MIVRARAVVTMDGDPIVNGAIAIHGNRIADVGPFRDVEARNSGPVIDLGEHALLPGFINAHCHLDYTDMRGAIPPCASFTDWIRAINQRKAAWSEADYLRSISNGFAEARMFGTTSIVNLEAFPEVAARMRETPLRTWWMAEMIDVREGLSAAQCFNEMGASAPRDILGGIGLAPHAPFTASAQLYSDARAVAAEEGVLLTTHLAESKEEMEAYQYARGPLFDFLESIGRRMADCGGTTPVAAFVEKHQLDESWIVAHLNELTDENLGLLARTQRFHIVHCPRSHAYFAHTQFRFDELRALGFRICLGTDSLASNMDLSLFAEMQEFQRVHPSVASREVLEMVTVNPALALDRQEVLGRLRIGSYADVSAIPFTGTAENLYDEIVAFSGDISWVMIDGLIAIPA